MSHLPNNLPRYFTTNAIAPYASELIGDTFDHTDDPNKAAQLLSHAILGAIIARVNGSNATSGAASAVVSEETSMILAKELYPEAFDENGNFDRSKLSEEQANGILALSSAIGAFTSGLSGGSVYDASVGGFVGQNAVEENAEGRTTSESPSQNVRTLNYNLLESEYFRLTGRRYETINATPANGEEYKPTEEDVLRLQNAISEYKQQNGYYNNIPYVSTIANPQLSNNIFETVDYILSGGKIPRSLGYRNNDYNKWGATFNNNFGDLPARDTNGNSIQYKEYMIRPLQSGYNNNVYRIVVGSDGNYYYSNTHYGDTIRMDNSTGIPFYRAGTLPQNQVNQIFGGK